MFNVRRITIRGARLALTAVLGLGLAGAAGCGTQYGRQTVKVNYYPDCYQPIASMRADEARIQGATAGGAVAGALLGAAIGALKDGGRGALIGAAAGAMAGGTAAYLLTDDIQKKDQAQRFAAYSAALDQDISGLSAAVAAARLTAKCYDNAYATLTKSYKAGSLGRPEMLARLQEIQDGANDAYAVLSEFGAEVAQRQQIYGDIKGAEAAKGSGGLKGKEMKSIDAKGGQVEKQQASLHSELRTLQELSAAMERTRQDNLARRGGGEAVHLAQARGLCSFKM